MNETWLRKGDTSKISEIKELGYNIQHVSRPGRGGGVAVAFKKNMYLTKCKKDSYKSFEHIECTLKSSSSEFLRIICIYRPGTGLHSKVSEFCEDFDDYLNNIMKKHGKILIAGDFNIHLEDANHPDTVRFLSVINQHSLKQHVNEPTHIGGGTIDLVLTRDLINERLDIGDIQVFITNSSSDHFLIKFPCRFIHSKITEKRKVSGRKVGDINLENFKHDLMTSDLNDSNKFINVDHATNLYNCELSRLLNKHAPLIEFQIREGQPDWLDTQCQKAKKHRRKCERLNKKENTEASRIAYATACKQAATVISLCRDAYYKDKLSLCKNDKKKTYSLVNHLMDKSTCSNAFPRNKEESVIAKEMKNHFHNKVQDIYSEIENSDSSGSPTRLPSFNGQNLHQFKCVDDQMLISVIGELSKKECELDPIPLKLLLKCLPELRKILLFIINVSLTEGHFPCILKEALIRPRVKDINGDLDNLNNYRPISNLPFLSKLLEKCVQKQLCSHLDKNNLHAEFQSGYRTNHSCETATLAMYNDLLCLTDAKSKVIILLLDLSAAFDTVCHKLLLGKLSENYGVSGSVLKWFASYLKDRSFFVKVMNSRSGQCFLRIGVPQGSILGPILFILYTKELEVIAKRHGFKIHLYADDTQIYIEFNPLYDDYNDIENRIIKCFEEISLWMNQNKLKLNASKTKAMAVSSRYDLETDESSLISIKLSTSETIECSYIVKSLGIYFDQHLTFDHQISDVVKICNMNLRNLWIIGSKLSFDLKKQLIHCLIFSKMDYCNGLYYKLPAYQLKRLQKLQNSCVRFLYGNRIKKFDRITPFLKEAHFLPVKERINFKIGLMIFKSINNVVPNYLKESIIMKGQLNISLRNENDYFLLESPAIPHLNQTDRGVFHAAPKIWNSLPYELRSLNDVNMFKKNLKTYLFNVAFNENG